MSEPRPSGVSQPLDLDRLLAVTGATLVRAPSRVVAIEGLGALDWAGPTDLAVLDDPAGADALRLTDAGACLVPPGFEACVPESAAALSSDDPRAAFERAAGALFPPSAQAASGFGPGVAAGAVVHPDARLEPDVAVEPGAVIGPRAQIGGGARIGANAVIGEDVCLGRDSVVEPGATVDHALIGDRVRIGAGARIGGGSGALDVGRVIVQDDAVIGANATIARGALSDTVVGESARIGALAAIHAGAAVVRFAVVPDHAALGPDAAFADHSTAQGGGQSS